MRLETAASVFRIHDVTKIVFKQTIYEGFIDISERTKTMQVTKRNLMQLRLKLDDLKEAMSKNKHMSGVNKTYKTRSDLYKTVHAGNIISRF